MPSFSDVPIHNLFARHGKRVKFLSLEEIVFTFFFLPVVSII